MVSIPTDIPYSEFIAVAKREYLKAALKKAGGNVTEVSRVASVNRQYVYRLMKRLEVSRSARNRRRPGNQAWQALSR